MSFVVRVPDSVSLCQAKGKIISGILQYFFLHLVFCFVKKKPPHCRDRIILTDRIMHFIWLSVDGVIALQLQPLQVFGLMQKLHKMFIMFFMGHKSSLNSCDLCDL